MRWSAWAPVRMLGWLLASAAVGACAGADAVDPAADSAGAPPNVVIILADDLGWGDLACQNEQSKVPTPQLDRLAREGLRFTDAHSPSAVCTPTRYGLLTGRYAWRTRLKRSVLWQWDPPLLEGERLTLPELFREAGYRTVCVGKWHLGWDWPTTDGAPAGRGSEGATADFSAPLGGGPLAHGFDRYFGDDVPNFPPYAWIEGDRLTALPAGSKPEDWFGHAGPMVPGWRLEAVMPALTARAVREVHQAAADGAPLFLYFPLTAPHTPIAPAAEFQGAAAAGAYGDFVHQVDHSVGAVLRALDDTGLAANTLVVFTSDNGSPARDGRGMSGPVGSVRAFGHDPSRPWRGLKSDIWEGGHRVPFLARWPGVTAVGAVEDEPICHTDLYRSLASLLGRELPPEAGEDSYDLLPLLRGEALDGPLREAIVHHSGGGLFAIRQGRWKLVLGLGPGGFSGGIREPKEGEPPGQLYDLQADPGETTNRYAERPEVVAELSGLLQRYRREGRSFDSGSLGGS